MEEDRIIKQRRIALVITVLLFISLIIFGIITYIINSQKTASIEILVAPSSAKIEINQKTYKNQKTTRIKPGEQTATISADGFTTQTVNINLIDNQTTKLYIILNPESGNENWYNNHPEDSTIVSIISDYYVTIEQNEYLAKYPITSILPIQIVEVNPITYDWTEFRIDYGKFDTCKSDFCLKITDSTGGNRERALQEIRDKGFDPDIYQVIYEYQAVEPLT